MSGTVKFDTLPERSKRLVEDIAQRVGISRADLKALTPTHVVMWNGRKIAHNLRIIRERIEIR